MLIDSRVRSLTVLGRTALLTFAIAGLGLLTAFVFPPQADRTPLHPCEEDWCYFNSFCWDIGTPTGCDQVGGGLCITYDCGTGLEP